MNRASEVPPVVLSSGWTPVTLENLSRLVGRYNEMIDHKREPAAEGQEQAA